MYTNFFASPRNNSYNNASPRDLISVSNHLTTATATKPTMSVFTAQQPFMFDPPSYSRSTRITPTKTEITPPAYKSSPSSISIPSISKLSFSFEPVKRILSGFTSAQTVELPQSQPFTRSANSSEAELSTVATRTTHSSSGDSEVEDTETVEPISVPPPTYSPIKVPSPSARQPTSPHPPTYEVQQEPSAGLERRATRRPQTGAGRPPITTPFSEYDAGYYGSYLGETWARPHAGGVGSRDGDPVDREKEEEESVCWCRSFWFATGSPTMPWVAYYVF